jgi:CRP-like cAMP-binding protein
MHDDERIVDILENVPLFSTLRKRQLANLARIFIERNCDPGEVIVPQGRDGYGFFIVAEGKAQAVREKSDGSTAILNTFGKNDFFGEIALLDNGPRTASVIATDETHCLILPRENFLGVLRRDGEMAVTIMVELTRRFRARLAELDE